MDRYRFGYWISLTPPNGSSRVESIGSYLTSNYVIYIRFAIWLAGRIRIER